MSDTARSAIAWGLVAVGLVLVAEVLLVDAYDIGTASAAFGWRTVALLGAGIAIAAAGAIGVWRTPASWPRSAALVRLARACAPGLVAFAVYFLAFVVMQPVPVGDQPHYELEALSLAHDHDRDLTNDYIVDSRLRFVDPQGLFDRHAYQYEPGGPYISVHHVGLPLLLATGVPFISLANAVNPKMIRWPWHLQMLVLAAIAAQLLYLILARLSPQRPTLRAAVWASVAFSPPLVIYASQIYPETPGALLVLLAFYALLQAPTRAWIVTGALATALLPWLHVRFLPIAGLLALALAWRAIAALAPAARGRAAIVRAALPALAPLALSVAVMALAFQHWYGSPLPDAQYTLTPADPGLARAYRSLAGALWSSERGWLPFAPVFILALAGIPLLVRRYGRPALAGIAIAAGYLALVTYQGMDPGFSFPGRFEVVLMALAAIPLLVLVEDVRWARPLFGAFAAVTLALTVALVVEPIPAVAGVPGMSGPKVPYVLWEWFTGAWPVVELEQRYPDVPGTFALTAAVVALALGALATARSATSERS